MIKPVRGYVLIKSDQAEEVTSAGIILPESVQEKPALGTVLAVGDIEIKVSNTGNYMIYQPCQVGDKVFYKKWSGDEIKYQGKDYKLVKFEDIMAIVKEK